MTPEQAQQLANIHAALFGTGTKAPIRWRDRDGVAKSSDYGLLDIEIHSQSLIARIWSAVQSLVKKIIG